MSDKEQKIKEVLEWGTKNVFLLFYVLPFFLLSGCLNNIDKSYQSNNNVNKEGSVTEIQNEDYLNCSFNRVFDHNGGTFKCQNGGGIDISFSNGLLFKGLEVNLEVKVPKEEEVYKTLSSEVPYEGAIEIIMEEISVPGGDLGEIPPRFVIIVPLKSKLFPGTNLEVCLSGETYGECKRLASFDDWSGTTISRDGFTASFVSNVEPFGLFIVRIPDDYSVPVINLDSLN